MDFIFFMVALVAQTLTQITAVSHNDDALAKLSLNLVKNGMNLAPDQSLAYSPFSLLTPLGQLALGSPHNSVTQTEIFNTLGVIRVEELTSSFTEVLATTKDVEGSLKAASKIYLNSSFQLNETFAKASRNYFNSEVEKLDFSQNLVEAAGKINSWVRSETNNRIDNMVDPAGLRGVSMILVNAVHFIANWSTAFNPRSTKDHEFHTSNGKTIQVPIMQQEHDFDYSEGVIDNHTFQMIRLPYKVNNMSMVITLPGETKGLSALVEGLKGSFLKRVHEMKPTKVNLLLPKFKIETESDLKTLLPLVGVKSIFDQNNAQLDYMAVNGKVNAQLYVSQAIQKVYIRVDEAGTEAAAANEFALIVGSSFNEVQAKVFKADHPFSFTIMQKDTILFSGVYNPNKMQ